MGDWSMAMTLSKYLHEPVGHGGINYLVDKAGFAAARHARHSRENAHGERDVAAFQIVLPHASDGEHPIRDGASHFGDGYGVFARKILARDGIRRRHDILDAARRHDLSAVHPRSGADVHDVIRLADGLLVMLHDDESVAEVAQPFQGSKQFPIVLLMQTDAGLVQNVEHSREPAAYLRREPDALALSARKRR